MGPKMGVWPADAPRGRPRNSQAGGSKIATFRTRDSGDLGTFVKKYPPKMGWDTLSSWYRPSQPPPIAISGWV